MSTNDSVSSTEDRSAEPAAVQRSLSLVVLAAGMGSRFGGIKQIAELGPSGEALIDYSVYDALRAGFNNLLFVIRPDIEDEVRSFFAGKFEEADDVDYVYQTLDDVPASAQSTYDRRKPWGTAHAVWSARNAATEPFAVINGDDFYGRHAFQSLAEALSAVDEDEPRFFLMGYPLGRTLSPHGPVSRAICKVDSENNLLAIAEHHDIEQDEEGRIHGSRDGSPVELTSRTYCSMNMLGFTPAVFPILTREFEAFLRERGHEPKAEFLIPTVLNTVIARGEATVEVIPTDAEWFGVTYSADTEAARAALRRLVDNGTYPEKLW